MSSANHFILPLDHREALGLIGCGRCGRFHDARSSSVAGIVGRGVAALICPDCAGHPEVAAWLADRFEPVRRIRGAA